MDKKRVRVIYFKGTGEVYTEEEEYVYGLYSQESVLRDIKMNVRYTDKDYIVLDGEDGVRPYIRPHLVKLGLRLR